MREDYTYLSRADITGSALGTSPRAVAAIEDLQAAAYQDGPADTAAAQGSADAAQASADTAQGSADAAQASADDATIKADAAQTSADSAGDRADAAQTRADNAYTLAQGKVTKTTITAPSTYAATASAAYDQAQMQALMDQLASVTTAVRAIAAALKV